MNRPWTYCDGGQHSAAPSLQCRGPCLNQPFMKTKVGVSIACRPVSRSTKPSTRGRYCSAASDWISSPTLSDWVYSKVQYFIRRPRDVANERLRLLPDTLSTARRPHVATRARRLSPG